MDPGWRPFFRLGVSLNRDCRTSQLRALVYRRRVAAVVDNRVRPVPSAPRALVRAPPMLDERLAFPYKHRRALGSRQCHRLQAHHGGRRVICVRKMLQDTQRVGSQIGERFGKHGRLVVMCRLPSARARERLPSACRPHVGSPAFPARRGGFPCARNQRATGP